METTAEVLSLSATFAVVFAVSLLAAHWFHRVAVRFRPNLVPAGGSTVRFRSESGAFRAKFIEANEAGWRISAPLSRGVYEPIRVGERLVVEAPHERGALLFETTVVARSVNPHELLLKAPPIVHATERRSTARRRFDEPPTIKVEGRDASLIDLTALGARVRCDCAFVRGERIRIDLPQSAEPKYGWVLDVEGSRTEVLLRVRFESTLTLSKTETAPAV